jgi:hypothetical protein
VVFVYTHFLWNLDTTFEEKRTSVPAFPRVFTGGVPLGYGVQRRDIEVGFPLSRERCRDTIPITVHSSPFNLSYGDGGLGFLARRETNVPQSTFVTDPGPHVSSASAILPTFGLIDGQ